MHDLRPVGIVVATYEPGEAMVSSGNLAMVADDRALADTVLDVARASGAAPLSTRLAQAQVASVRAGLHVVSEGYVKRVRFSAQGRALMLELVGAGDAFGEGDLVADDDVEPVYVEALTPARFETIAPLELERLLRTRASLALALARNEAARRRRVERRLEAQIFQNVPTRLAHELLELARRYGKPDPRGTHIAVPLNQQDLGCLIGASRESVSLTLNQFRRLGAVTSTRRRLVVRRAELAEIARESRLG